MANLTSVVYSAGAIVGTTAGTVSTLDNLIGVAGTPSPQVITIQGVSGGVAVPISAAALPLPAGAATAAKQPALGTAGTPSADVISIQGVVSGIAIPVSIASLPSGAVTNAGTFAVQATLVAGATTAIGKVDPNTIGTWGLQVSTQNSATPTNGELVLGQFNTSPTTITAGNVSPLQLDNAGNLLVNIKAGSSSGAVAQGSTTSGQTGSLMQGAVTTGAPTYTTAQTSPLSLDTAGNLRTIITNANANGRAVPGSSAPVVLNSMTGTFVAASATATQLGSTGAIGDVLDGILVIPGTAAAGAVSVLWDGTNTRTIFAGGGTTALPTLAPFYVPLGFLSGNSGGFKITTGTNVSVIGVGNFT